MKVKLKMEGPLPPLVKLPADLELLLFLIREDLKAHKLSNALNEIGSVETPYLSDMSALVLAAAGFDERTDDMYNFYFGLMDKYSSKLNGDNEVLMKQVMKVYVRLNVKMINEE
jgi:hypothetical protein